ncbi:MAG: hypothetical protein IPN72_19330 [Saprospiraceae bacterium]|nr:hypothetical protein [Saprospiraceae bacterium]
MPIASLPAMTQTTVDITFTINNQTSSSITNTAEISSATGGTDLDSSPGNGTGGSAEDDFGSVALDVCIPPNILAEDYIICESGIETGADIDLSTIVQNPDGATLTFTDLASTPYSIPQNFSAGGPDNVDVMASDPSILG